MKVVPLFSIIFLALTGCTKSGTLYPANKEAQKIGALNIQYKDFGTNAGPVQVMLPDGETLKGEYRVVDNSVAQSGFASTFASGNAMTTGNGMMYGAGGIKNYNFSANTSGSASAFTNSYGVVTPGSTNGFCAMTGDKGTSGNCNFVVNTFSSKGGGVCNFSNGAAYNLMF